MIRVNEIFYSLQGEGRWAGTPAVFLRLSGCNLKCSFCDTAHLEGYEMNEDDILTAVSRFPARHVVITGGEPCLQLTSSLLSLLSREKKFVQIETNGSIDLPADILNKIDWITCSPKNGSLPKISRIDELKVLFFIDDVFSPEKYERVCVTSGEYRLQPCDYNDETRNKECLKRCIDYILTHPQWKLSLQTHKLIGIK